MATEIKLPRLGQGMDEGKILRWLKAEGDVIESGDEIYEVETEKVNVEVEATASGTLLKIVVGEGNEVPIGTVIAYLGEPGEAVPDAPASGGTKPAAKTPATASAAPASSVAAGTTSTTAATPAVTSAAAPTSAGTASSSAGTASSSAATARASDNGSRLKASPLARRIAREQGLDLAALHGSGPEGRIVARDLEHAKATPVSITATTAATVTAGPGGETLPLTSMRKTIARRLTEAWQAPAFFLTVSMDMTRTNELRAKLVASMREGDTKPTVSDIITRACASALRRHPDMNVHFAGDAIIRYADVHVGMAVATDAGLVVPVIRDAHAKSVRELADDRAAIVAKARNNKLAPADFEGGTFTISNLGMMGIDEFTAVLNPPMAAILAVGRTKDEVVAINRKPEIRPMMTVTLTCDHRAVDGAVGARFLQTLKAYLEDPMTMV